MNAQPAPMTLSEAILEAAIDAEYVRLIRSPYFDERVDAFQRFQELNAQRTPAMAERARKVIRK